MNHPDYNSPVALKAFLDENSMAMQKKFGQNFMLNQAAREKIIDALCVSENMKVWEVGPGLGCMTDILLNRGCDVTVFEIDRGFIKFNREFFSEYEDKNHFRIVEGDVLKTWKKQYENEEEKPSRLMGNLPYNIAATFIADTVSNGVVMDKCIFTVQKEVADRMLAKCGTENYSSFSVICQYAYELTPVITLAPGNFWPRPNVASTAILMEKKDVPVKNEDSKMFFKTVHTLFASRRKTVYNNLKPMINSTETILQILEKAGIQQNERAENLTVDQFLTLSRIISDVILESKRP